MNLGFQDRFVPFVEDGSKTHTIRAGERWKVGMRADLFAESRRRKVYDADGRQTAGMRLLFRAPVVKVESFELYPPPLKFRCPLCGTRELHDHLDYFEIFIDSMGLGSDERDAFAWRDGFRPWKPDPSETTKPYSTLNTMAFRHMMEFWARTRNIEQLVGPFQGQIIHWDYAQRFMRKDGGPDLGRDSGKSRELQARGRTAADIAVPDTRERLCDGRRPVIRRDSRERPA